MTLAPGASSSEAGANEHARAEQWLFVVSDGQGADRKGSIKLQEGTLILIEKREPHEITAGPRARLVTMNIYVPPAYDDKGEPLRKR